MRQDRLRNGPTARSEEKPLEPRSGRDDTDGGGGGETLEVGRVERELGATAPAAPAVTLDTSGGACAPDATRLCLLGGRFAVEADWRDFEGRIGVGAATPWEGGETGTFWFFDPANVELIVKVLDGTALNGRYWVYFGALSNVEYTVTVTDTLTGTVRTYYNPAGVFASVGDVDAF